jgi:hypothetical protein
MSPTMSQEQPKRPLEDETIDPKGPGSEPDYFPGKPAGDLPKLQPMSRHRRLFVSWHQAH